MPFEHEYGDSTPDFNSENEDNWQRLDSVIARLSQRVDSTLAVGQFEAAETFHKMRVDAEMIRAGFPFIEAQERDE